MFTPTLLTILGVIMYLRLGWVVGNGGLLGGWLVLFLAVGIIRVRVPDPVRDLGGKEPCSGGRPMFLLLLASCATAPVLPGGIVGTYYDYDPANAEDPERWELGRLDLSTRRPAWDLVVPMTNTFEETPDVAADGRIAFGRSATEGDWLARELWTVRPDGTGLRQLTDNDVMDGHPSWSPDGARILFSSWRDDPDGADPDHWADHGGPDSELYVMNADGTNVVRLTDSAGEDIDGEWSPDGTRIVFKSTRDTREYHEQIYVMDAATGEVARLTDNGWSDHDPAWSPDGSSIAIERYLGSGAWNDEGSDREHPQSSRWQIVVIAVDSGAETVVADENGVSLYWLPQWSPDGAYLAFIDNYVVQTGGDSESRIVYVSSAGGPIEELQGGEEVGYFDWAR